MYDGDFLGWQLDDVLEGYDVDYVLDGVAIDSTGEPRNALLDESVRDKLDCSDGPMSATFARGRKCVARGRLAQDCDCVACSAWRDVA